jgi:hypothetical protein
MLPFALILLAAATRVELVNEVIQIPAGDWRYVEVTLKQRPAFVLADYTLPPGSSGLRMELIRREELDKLQNSVPDDVLAVAPEGATGRLRYRVTITGEYALVIDNRDGTRTAAPQVRVYLDFLQPAGPQVTALSPMRRLTVVVISFAVFFGIVIFAARRLLRGIRS